MWNFLLPTITPIIDKLVGLIPDHNARAKAKEEFELELQRAVTRASEMQVEVNKIEAAHSSVFVAGWRAGLGWCCVLAVAWAFIGQPIALWSIQVFDLPVSKLPEIQTDYLFELVFAMLGLGGLRTVEKIKGVARDRIK